MTRQSARRVWLSLVGPLVACGGQAPVYPQTFAEPTRGLVVIGDMQRTNDIDALFRQNEQNDLERRQLVDAIAALAADGVVNLGDLVADGSLESDWHNYDELTASLRAQDLGMLVAIGNHEYWRQARLSLSYAHARFAALASSHHYSRVYGALLLVWVDSNADDLTGEVWRAQSAWLGAELARADADPAIRGVLLFSHHPPFSNSGLIGDNSDVQEAFLPAFVGSRKTLAWFAGHVHAYERFQKDGKTFIISGGGGGPRTPVAVGPDAAHTNLFAATTPVDTTGLGPFHYLQLLLEADHLRVRAEGFGKGESTVRLLEEVLLPLAASDE